MLHVDKSMAGMNDEKYLDHCAGLLQETGQPLAARASSYLPEPSIAAGLPHPPVSVPSRRNGPHCRLQERIPQGCDLPTEMHIIGQKESR
jgi:hypothetical protein